MVMIASCRYLAYVVLWIMLFRRSRTRSLQARILRRMENSSGLARSAISSSLMIASLMACSTFLNVDRREAFAVIIGVPPRSLTSASRQARAARSEAPMSISARGDSVEPISARCSCARTSENAIIGVPPR